jgi:hypothetical protein
MAAKEAKDLAKAKAAVGMAVEAAAGKAAAMEAAAAAMC